MQTVRRIGILASVPAALWFIGCSDANAPQSTADTLVTLDVAQYSADATSDDILMMTDGSATAFTAPSAAGPFDGSLTFTRQVTYLDADGAEMTSYDPLLTASIHFVMSLDGTRSLTGARGTLSVTVSRSRDFTVSGLLGQETERTWNGTGSASKNRVVVSTQSGDRTYDFSATTTVTDVVIPVPHTADSWPLSGTITREVTVQVVNGLGDTITRDRTVVVTFNGTEFVPLTVNGVEYTLDLATREIVASGG
jgi:hypothetical protein